MRTCLIILTCLTIAACSNPFRTREAPPLPGEREAVLPAEQLLRADARVADVEVVLPTPAENSDWPQSGGYPNHAMHHLMLGSDPRQVWSADIGAGSSRFHRLLAQPVVGGGRVFTMDSRGEVRAFDAASGRRIWGQNMLPRSQRASDLGGGVGYAEGRLYVSTGAGEVIAVNPENGSEIWRVSVGMPVRAAPTISAGRVFIVDVENRVLALNAENGERVWTYAGAPAPEALLGAASPAVDGGIVVVPMTTGEVVALRAENGRELWLERLSGVRLGTTAANLPDVRAHPVVDRGVAYAVSNAGRLAAIEVRSGRRLWDIDIGSRQAPWVAGDMVYTLTNHGQLLAIMRNSGQIRWAVRLDNFVDDRQLRRLKTISWVGPVLASDRLLIAGEHGEALAVSPYTGEVLGWIPTGPSVVVQPAVAGSTIYLLNSNGRLTAMR